MGENIQSEEFGRAFVCGPRRRMGPSATWTRKNCHGGHNLGQEISRSFSRKILKHETFGERNHVKHDHISQGGYIKILKETFFFFKLIIQAKTK